MKKIHQMQPAKSSELHFPCTSYSFSMLWRSFLSDTGEIRIVRIFSILFYWPCTDGAFWEQRTCTHDKIPLALVHVNNKLHAQKIQKLPSFAQMWMNVTMHRAISLQIVRILGAVTYVLVVTATMEMENPVEVSPAIIKRLGQAKRGYVSKQGWHVFCRCHNFEKTSDPARSVALTIENGCRKTRSPEGEHREGGGNLLSSSTCWEKRKTLSVPLLV